MTSAAEALEPIHGALLVHLNEGGLAAETDEALRSIAVRIEALGDDRFDGLSLVRECLALVDSVLLPAEDGRGIAERLRPLLADAERSLAMVHFHPPTGARPRHFAQSREPILKHLERPLIVSRMPEPERFLVPSSTPRKDGLLLAPLPAYSVEGWALERMELLLSDVAVGMSHRVPLLGESWRQAEVIERRLLAAVDALLAIDPGLLPLLEAQVTRSPAVDPSYIAALALVGGGLSGRDGLAMAERLRLRLREEPASARLFEVGLGVVPNPFVDQLARGFLRSDLAEERALGLGILARRERATQNELLLATRDGEVVAERALVALAIECAPEIRDLLDEAYGTYSATTSPSYRRAYRQAALLSGHPYAMSLLTAAYSEDATAPILVALAAERREAQELLGIAQTATTVPLIDALGWAGDPGAIPFLLWLLEGSDEDQLNSAAAALERLTGAGLRQEIEVPAERLLDETEAPEETDPKDPLPTGSPDTIELPSRDPVAWRAYCATHEARLVPGVRTRRGVPYSPLVSFTELRDFPCTKKERDLLHDEIMIRSGICSFFSTDDFVAVQERKLATLRGHVESANGIPGAWERPLQRRLVRL